MSSKNLCILIKFEFIQTKKLGDCSEHANLHSAKCCNLLRKAGLPNLSSSHSWLSPCRTLHCLENPTTTARLVSNNWLFRSFHGHKGLILRPVEPPMPALVRPPGTLSFSQHTHNALTAVLWSENAPQKEKVKGGVLSHFFPEREAQRNRLLRLDIENKAWDSA